VLILHDPDASVSGGWDHWVLFNLPRDARALAENQPKTATLPNGATHGRNSWGNLGYGGPCPPAGLAHRYQFRLIALDTVLTLSAGATKAVVLAETTGHVLGETLLTGLYARQ